MAEPRTRNLRLYSEDRAKVVCPQIETVGSLPEVLRAFNETTGWSLRYFPGQQPNPPADLTWSAPVNPGVGVPPGHLRLEPVASTPVASAEKPLKLETVRSMASALADMLGEMMQTRYALWHREAELAAGVPLVSHEDEEKHLAERLEAVLKGGADAVGCQAAALYLLDEATTELKLRSCWGLPFERLCAPARPLKGAVADLEALLGHAVVLEDTELMRHWRVPEEFPAAVCVPISTPTTLLGTLWVFCNRKRDFNSRQTNVLEVVAGRIAADLEREMLMREGIDAVQLKRQVAAAERMQRNQFPTISPMLDGWQLSGWTQPAATLGGDFYDWFCPGDGLLAVAVGDAMQQGLAAAMAASNLRSALRAHAQYHREAHQTLQKVNMTLWTASAGDQYASLFFGLIETATGRVNYAVAGRPSAITVREGAWKSLSVASTPLGKSPESQFEPFGYELRPGEALMIFTDAVRDATDGTGRMLGEAGIAKPLLARPGLSAEQSAVLARETLNAHAAAAPDDRTVLVINRT